MVAWARKSTKVTQTVGYGCTTCIGNSGPLHPALEEAIAKHDLIAASVLSGNRNFEARVHQNIHANFLMSPPLVVAFALAGGRGRLTPARLAFDRPIAIACFADRAPCSPSRT